MSGVGVLFAGQQGRRHDMHARLSTQPAFDRADAILVRVLPGGIQQVRVERTNDDQQTNVAVTEPADKLAEGLPLQRRFERDPGIVLRADPPLRPRQRFLPSCVSRHSALLCASSRQPTHAAICQFLNEDNALRQ